MIATISTTQGLAQYARTASTAPAPAPAQPASPDKVSVGQKHHRGAVANLLGTLFAGIGLGSGATGGAILGGSVFSAGASVRGLLAHSFTFANAGHAGMVGAGIGAIVFGIAGAYGGWTLADTAVRGAEWIKDKASNH